jgi:hypothetical protein
MAQRSSAHVHIEQAMSDMGEQSALSSVTTHIFGLNLLK